MTKRYEKNAATASLLAIAIACGGGSSDPSPPTIVVPEAGPIAREGSFGLTPCAKCVNTECSTSRAACTREPTCARWLLCVDDCNPSEIGGVDATCADACPAPEGSTPLNAKESHLACSTNAAPSPCRDCGGDPTKPSAVLAQKCPKGTATDSCERCEESRCCDTNARCTASDDCKALNACYNDCDTGDHACEQRCFAEHPSSLVMWGQYIGCSFVACAEATACNYAGGDPGILCWTRECSTPYIECRSQADCVIYEACFFGCPDAACRSSCAQRYPGGKRSYDSFLGCQALRCGNK